LEVGNLLRLWRPRAFSGFIFARVLGLFLASVQSQAQLLSSLFYFLHRGSAMAAIVMIGVLQNILGYLQDMHRFNELLVGGFLRFRLLAAFLCGLGNAGRRTAHYHKTANDQ